MCHTLRTCTKFGNVAFILLTGEIFFFIMQIAYSIHSWQKRSLDNAGTLVKRENIYALPLFQSAKDKIRSLEGLVLPCCTTRYISVDNR